jgi:hypothetical protein
MVVGAAMASSAKSSAETGVGGYADGVIECDAYEVTGGFYKGCDTGGAFSSFQQSISDYVKSKVSNAVITGVSFAPDDEKFYIYFDEKKND